MAAILKHCSYTAPGDGGKCSTRKVFVREAVRQCRMSLGWFLSDNVRVGQLPASLPQLSMISTL